MPPRTKETDKQVVSFTVGTLVSCLLIMVGALVSGTWTAAVALRDINSKLAIAWTIEDAERQRNWLIQDNHAIGLKVRDTDEIVRARYYANR